MSETLPDTKSGILDIALELFALKGYGAVGTQEICDRAGVTKPTLYHHFGSKRGLLEAIMERWGEPYLAAIGDAAVYGKDLVRGLNAVFSTIMSRVVSEPHFHRLLLALYFAPPEAEDGRIVRALHTRVYEIVLAFFHRAEADHGNMKGRADRYAMGFLGHANTWVGLQLNGAPCPDENTVQKLVHQFMHGIFS